MSFLVSAKTKRETASNLDNESDNQQETSDCDQESVISQAAHEAGIDCFADDVSQFANSSQYDDAPGQMEKTTKVNVKPRYKKQKKCTDDYECAESGLMTAMKHRLEDNKESPRLKFFKSIMPRVDSLSEDQFLDFQIEVLQLLKRHSQPTIPNDGSRPSTSASCPLPSTSSVTGLLHPTDLSVTHNAISSRYPCAPHTYFSM